MKPLVLRISDFSKSMLTNIYESGLRLVEHFDTTFGQLRPFHELVLSTATLFAVSSVTADKLSAFIKVGSSLYCLCVNDGSPATTQGIGIWETSGFTWPGTAAPGSFGATGASAFDSNGAITPAGSYSMSATITPDNAIESMMVSFAPPQPFSGSFQII